ncbi:4-phosphoerythronate dehydrogenase [Fodinibius roseus]|uniref:4-phosphoerythronate dehydrogenase n=1 Tax=Fodinibius roseus TaxID=1194090 RepID=A0A1M4WDX6_9BACT|nr:NAD(P)-dependent oxidoreductase [Fodinibius roseus]SHE79424.1 4-phosphoerythronate dehydrogenase [Fodinibius roseus]
MITVFADQHLYKIASFFPDSIDLILFDPSEGLPDDLHRAQGLLIRTVNPINPRTLPEIPGSLSFIGTGSSGTDHVDRDHLKKNGVAFVDAAGCNARSVAEYIAASLLIWSEQEQKPLENRSVGIVGVGHVGFQVQKILDELDRNIQTVGYDPPRDQREASFTSAPLDQLLHTDILTFHTPLTTSGEHPTFHWLDEEKLSRHSFELVINTARGGIVDEQALLKAQQEGSVPYYMLDVWENEPEIDLRSAEKAYLKTPHIAGYSIQAKLNASQYVADALLAHFNIDQKKQRPEYSLKQVDEPVDHFKDLPELMKQLHPIGAYEAELRRILSNSPRIRGRLFNNLRAEFPLRHEFSHIRLRDSYFERFPVLKNLGFRIQVI